jgi:hypothetical protein
MTTPPGKVAATMVVPVWGEGGGWEEGAAAQGAGVGSAMMMDGKNGKE